MRKISNQICSIGTRVHPLCKRIEKRAFTGKFFRCKRSFCLILLTLSQKKSFNRVWKLLQSQQTKFLQRQGIEGLVCICARVTSDDGSTHQVEFTIAFHPSHIVQYF